MNVWKFDIVESDGTVLYSDCGFEMQVDAEEEAKDIINGSGHDWDLSQGFDVRTYQVWQELEYAYPTQVLFFDTELQEEHAGIAYEKEVICAECGGIFELGEVEILAEREWESLSWI